MGLCRNGSSEPQRCPTFHLKVLKLLESERHREVVPADERERRVSRVTASLSATAGLTGTPHAVVGRVANVARRRKGFLFRVCEVSLGFTALTLGRWLDGRRGGYRRPRTLSRATGFPSSFATTRATTAERGVAVHSCTPRPAARLLLHRCTVVETTRVDGKISAC